MTDKKNLMTKEGYERLLQKRDEAQKKQDEAWARVGEAAGPEGNWHDNAAYDQARVEYDVCVYRLREIDLALANAEIIEIGQSSGVVEIGSIVTLEINGEKETYQILGEADSDPALGRISYKSPIAQAILGFKENDVTTVKIPAGTLQIKILAIKS